MRQSKQKRIGLLGGTFNPIHQGHLHIAQSVFKPLHLDFILFIPSNIPPHKDTKNLPAARHRLEMVRLALADTPHFKACDFEVNRVGPSYTTETVRALMSRYPDAQLFFIIGMDAFSQIETWKEAKGILSYCNFAVISRPGFPFSSLPLFGPLALADRPSLLQLDHGEKSYYTVSISQKTALHFIRIPHSEISASVIRKRISEGRPIRNLLPHPVELYIINHKIYKGDGDF